VIFRSVNNWSNEPDKVQFALTLTDVLNDRCKHEK